MTPESFAYLRQFLKERSGLALAPEKGYLAESRLLPLARRRGIAGLDALVARLQDAGDDALAVEVVEAMTTNETFFFRDKIPFEHVRTTVMPALMAARGGARRIRIWCAAASSGQEPYSLAMLLKEMGVVAAGWRVEIVATDIAAGVLAKARSGLYSHFEVQRGLPITLLIKHFTQVGEQWQIAPDIRAMVQFRPLNLLRDFSNLGAFDAVFCRNVLIYFDELTKIDVLERLAGVTAPDGFLTLGAAETVVGLTRAFRPVADRRGLYAPVPAAAARARSGALALVAS